MFELHHWGHLAELLGFEHNLAVHAELLRCVLQRLLVLSLTCPLARALGLCITETHLFGWADLVIGALSAQRVVRSGSTFCFAASSIISRSMQSSSAAYCSAFWFCFAASITTGAALSQLLGRQFLQQETDCVKPVGSSVGIAQ